MKKLFAILAVALLVVACGGQKTEDKAAEETINGLVPGADYLVYTNGWKNVMTFYNDGTAVSSLSGDCVWSYESIKDQSFVEVEIIENYGTYYIDENLNLYVDNVNSKGSKMERINYIPKNAKGMVVGKRYTMPDFRWDEDAFITLNEDGTVSSEFQGSELNLPKWKKVVNDGVEWIVIYYDSIYTYTLASTGEIVEEERNGGFIVSPSLEYYSLGYDDKNIKFLGGEVTFGDNWKANRQGRLDEVGSAYYEAEAEAEVEAEAEAEVAYEAAVPMVYSNCYDGYLNVRAEPSSKSKVVGTLRNGPEGAELLGVEGKWTKVSVNGVVGYIWSADTQSYPSDPVYIDASAVVGKWAWCDENAHFDSCTIESNGDFYMSGYLSMEASGKWHLSGHNIILKYDNGETIVCGVTDNALIINGYEYCK